MLSIVQKIQAQCLRIAMLGGATLQPMTMIIIRHQPLFSLS